MCEVELSICVHCGKVFAAKMKYCDPVRGKLLVADSTPFEISSSFNWSPMEGCDGLQIHPTANLDACRNDITRPEVPFDRPAAARPSARSPYPTPMALQRTDMPEQLPQAAGVEEQRQGVAMTPLGSDVQLQLQMQIQMQTEPPTGDTPTVGSPMSSWSGSTVSYY
ncbi:hypothetical protein BBK36DRAFT_1191792 [Trichoderma citrinoviride]|uniref:Uncharacterized protein n=1 Tax=Trichoderma citrinoviride TaxID=58853 RepID=A0A2T4BHF5_9HYPO|nr:hypothetical protein BBK36DRAFT_1191792 [Trichoderma citrinoviride]PTB68753.1 hypothetical protein BBK36DRAFT_1191792 [Trichoderma citrinoviride]